ncbi:transposase DDE domain protein [Vibrio parahaemolyticus VPTS-2010]|nr:transposase DDE domain protein [Vibrio parahaemolyticus VPTS-2010]
MSSLLHNKAEWKHNKQGKRGRPQQFSDLAITSALIVKPVFSIPLRSIQYLIIDGIGLKVFSEGE